MAMKVVLQTASDLLHRQSLHPSEEDHFTVVGRKRREGLLETLKTLVALNRDARSGVVGRRIAFERRGAPTALPPGLIAKYALRDYSQPAQKGVVAAPLEARKGTECTQKRLLDNVRGIRLSPKATIDLEPGQQDQIPPTRAEHLTECFRVAAPSFGKKPF